MSWAERTDTAVLDLVLFEKLYHVAIEIVPLAIVHPDLPAIIVQTIQHGVLVLVDAHSFPHFGRFSLSAGRS